MLVSLVLVTLAGCSPGTGGFSGGVPKKSSASPTSISSSTQVVKATTQPISITTNGSADAIVSLSISPGYHVNANPATYPYLIATEVRVVPTPDLCVDSEKPTYPPAVNKQFPFADKPLAVYEGEVNVRLPLGLPPKCYVSYQRGAHVSVPIEVKIQACDQEKCFPPATLEATIPVEVK